MNRRVLWSQFVAAVVAAVGPAFLAAQRPALTVEGPTHSIGVEEGDPNLTFGHLIDVEADPSGKWLFLLDRMNGSLSMFSIDGRFIARTGRLGAGPGEFRVATAISVAGSHVYVLDRANVRISQYEFTGDSLQLVDELRLPFDAYDLCAMDRHIYLFGLHDGRILHRLDSTGTLERSFGTPFHEDPVLARTTARGALACDLESGSLVVTPSLLPIVRLYKGDGSLAWEASVPGFVAPTITRNGFAGVRISVPDDREYSDVMVSATFIDPHLMVVQFGAEFFGMGSLEDILDVTSIVFRRGDGVILSRDGALPRLDGGVSDLVFSHANDPFPIVQLYNLHRRGGG